MKTATISTAVIAALAAGTVAVPTISTAQPYGAYRDDCRAREHSNGTAGAVIGGIAGALLGSSVAPHHGNRAGGAAIGGVTGAVVGNSIGRSSGKSNCYNQGYYQNGRYYSYDQRQGYYRDGRYYSYAPTYSAPTYYSGRYDGRYGSNTYYAPRYDYRYQTPSYYDPY
ncbi:MAG: glycine zipper domain-containing protein [Phenylobacterium sp.]